mmetsp:Transcript_13990/g.25854  ORF Transcript_13990/g.25854 Transcript_13990/m.25854 type:complete len:518 (-) Transcript_13990:23-1576(-)
MLSKLLLTEDQEEQAASNASASKAPGVYSKSRIKARTKQNLWNVKQERPELFGAAAPLQATPAAAVPSGFEKCGQEGWLRHTGRNLYLEVDTGKLYWFDAIANEYKDFCEGTSMPLAVVGSAAVSLGRGASPATSSKSTPGAKPVAPRHVVIPDLHRTALALKLDLDHLDRPAAFLAVYGVATPQAEQQALATEAATLTLHERLIRHLAAHRGAWSESMLSASISGLLSGIASEHGDSPPFASVALLVGSKIVTTAVSGSCAIFVRVAADGTKVVSAIPGNSDIRPVCHQLTEGAAESGYVVMFAGDGEMAGRLELVADEVAPHLAAARPKAASLAVLRAARRRQATGPLVTACARLGPPVDVGGGSAAERPSKKQKTEDSSAPHMVRVRQILLRHHKGTGPEPHDPIRRIAIRRSQEEAELQMLQVLEGIIKDGLGSFSSACKACSECQSALKGGELAGDVGWLDKEKGSSTKQADRAVKSAVPPVALRVAFDLEVGQLGDLVSSEVGTHLLLRTA